MYFSTPQRNNLITGFAAILLLITGVWRYPLSHTRSFMAEIFVISVILLFVAILLMGLELKKIRFNKWIVSFLVLSLWSMYYPFNTIRSYQTFQSIFVAIIWIYLVVLVFDKKTCEKLMDAMCMAALANIAILIIQEIMEPGYNNGFQGNSSCLSSYLSLCFPAFLRKNWHWGLMPLMAGIVAAKSSTGFLSVMIGGTLYVVFNLTLWLLLIFPVLALLFFIFVDIPGAERFTMWRIAFDTWKQHPLFGIGLGHFWTLFSGRHIVTTIGGKQIASRWLTAHNEYLQTLLEMGIFSGLIFTGYFSSIFLKIRKNLKFAMIPLIGIIITAINAFGNFTFHIGSTAILGLTWIAIIEVYLWGYESCPAA